MEERAQPVGSTEEGMVYLGSDRRGDIVDDGIVHG
jgi:hypothetical protein